MIEITIIYLMIYAYATHKMITLSKLAIAQAHVTTLKSLDDFIADNTSPQEVRDMGKYRADIVKSLKSIFEEMSKSSLKSCFVNGIYLCPMVLFFCIIDEDSFSETFILEYQKSTLENFIETLSLIDETSMDIKEVIQQTIDVLGVDDD
jgi:hypothetical protein